MNKQFQMSNLGLLKYYLGIEVHQGKECTTLKQSAYAKKILKKEFGILIWQGVL